MDFFVKLNYQSSTII